MIFECGKIKLKIKKKYLFVSSDFGLSRNIEDENEDGLTEYVVTRYYRSPEIMLSSHEVLLFFFHNYFSITNLLIFGLLVAHLRN